MRIVRHLCIALFLLGSKAVIAQSNISLQTAKDEHCTYITPTLSNITKLLFASNEDYVKSLESYSYIKAASGGEYSYMASIDTRSHFRLINKEDRIVLMMFSPNDVNLVSTFRAGIKALYNDVVVEYEDGYEVYRVLIPNDGLKFRVMFRLKEEVQTNTIQGRSITTNSGILTAIIK
jgi:hypothetical protein